MAMLNTYVYGGHSLDGSKHTLFVCVSRGHIFDGYIISQVLIETQALGVAEDRQGYAHTIGERPEKG